MPAVMRLGALLLFLMMSCQVLGQTNASGSLYGRILDDSGAPVADALVTLSDPATGLQRAQATNSEGRFRFTSLPISRYDVLIEAAGFQATEESGVVVNVGVGTLANATLQPAPDTTADLGVLEIEGAMLSMIDISSTESTTIFTDQDLDRLPVYRHITDVALLAPGATLGDRGLGYLVSFGGASVAENAFYINGMDVTNFRNGLGGSTVPFEFFQEFQIKTGGYGAEFGRATGGVINTVSKRGSNEWRFGVGGYWEPDALREDYPDIPNPEDYDGYPRDYYRYGSERELERRDFHVYGSGPIVEDRLFFYALVQHNHTEYYQTNGPVSVFGVDKDAEWIEDNENTFWALKLDWQINNDHLLEFTAFSDERTNETQNNWWDFDTESMQPQGVSISDRGGQNYILRYTGHLTDSFTLSAMAGESEYDRTSQSDKDVNPVIADDRVGAQDRFLGDWLNQFTGTASDLRRMYRLDGEWDQGRHLLRFGADYQLNRSDDYEFYSGGVFWRYYTVTPGSVFRGIEIPDDVDQVARKNIRELGGSFDIENTAFYLEDHWQITENTLLYLGVRNETFDNKNAEGDTWIKMDNQWAPRLGFTWDVRGDGRSKLFGTAGRYHLPMPSQVSIFQSGAWLFNRTWYELIDLNPDGTPIVGAQLAFEDFADGSVPETEELLSVDLEPMYQDEFILGYVFEPAAGWSVGVRGIYRDLQRAIDDVDLAIPINDYALRNGYEDFWVPDYTFVMINPGEGATVRFDMDGDGQRESHYLTAKEIGLPEVKRTYKAIELWFEKAWNGVWNLQGSYTYSENKGNYEGRTDSFFDRADGALTPSFDYPEYTNEYAYGYLPNDRPHTFKLFGGWDFADNWRVSFNAFYQSGRAWSKRGIPPGPYPWADGFYADGEWVRRGSSGRTSSVKQLDLGLIYALPISWRQGQLQLRLDVFNVFDSETELEIVESTQRTFGARDTRFGYPSNWQIPRFVRLGVRLDF